MKTSPSLAVIRSLDLQNLLAMNDPDPEKGINGACYSEVISLIHRVTYLDSQQ